MYTSTCYYYGSTVDSSVVVSFIILIIHVAGWHPQAQTQQQDLVIFVVVVETDHPTFSLGKLEMILKKLIHGLNGIDPITFIRSESEMNSCEDRCPLSLFEEDSFDFDSDCGGGGGTNSGVRPCACRIITVLAVLISQMPFGCCTSSLVDSLRL